MFNIKPKFKVIQEAGVVFLFLLLTLFSCKKENHQNVQVIRNCTGTYLRWDGKDYHVCNLEKVAGFADDASIRATFKKIKTCNGSAMDQFVCDMLYPNEGFIEVIKAE